ncbi:MAG: DUF1501 domain-containing protein [Thalassotalea sp.]
MSNTSPDHSRRKFLSRTSLIGLSASITANSLGVFSLVNSTTTLAATQSDFKALVYVFLNGGNDAFNMLVPSGNGELRHAYEAGRGNVAIAKDTLNTITPVTPAKVFANDDYNDFGLHPQCPDMAQMFNNQEISFICNMGNLTVPTTRQQYLDNAVSLPPQLFSHADQQRQFQSSPVSPFQFGWGGRMVELLTDFNTTSLVSPLISVAGLNTLQVTKDSLINPYVMSNDGATPLYGFSGTRKTMIENAINSIDDNSHLMMKKYRDIFLSARNAEEIVGSAFDIAKTNGVDYDAIFDAAGGDNSVIARRLKTVAKMIAGRDSTGNNRPIYFVELGGFDNHQNLLSDHQDQMQQLNAALKGFRDSLIAQGDFNNTLTFVGSEFARTLTPNSDKADAGTDHAWGGHAIIMGGMVNGGHLFGTHPDLKLNQGLDASNGRGRWIPTTATTQCNSVIAHWFGVEKEDLTLLFPSVDNFPSPFEPEANLDLIKTGDVA